MSTIIIASLDPGEGRSAVAAGLAACLAERSKPVRLLRMRAESGADPAAEDDARVFTLVPGCESSGQAATEQDAQSTAGAAGATVIEAMPGESGEGLSKRLAASQSAKVVLVTDRADGQRAGELATAAEVLGGALLGVVVTRQAERALEGAETAMTERGLTCLGVLPEDRLLAGPTPREMAEALHASHLVDDGEDDEAVEFVMLGPLTADPGQPYFLQHGAKAVVNRFDKMDLHLAALATDTDCLILTGGQQPSPYLMDRIAGGDGGLSVLLSPEGTVRTVELVDELYGRTRFVGRRKIARATELVGQHVDLNAIENATR